MDSKYGDKVRESNRLDDIQEAVAKALSEERKKLEEETKTSDGLICLHDWGWTLFNSHLLFACKNKGCPYDVENPRHMVGLVKFRDIIFAQGFQRGSIETLTSLKAELEEKNSDIKVIKSDIVISQDAWKQIWAKRNLK